MRERPRVLVWLYAGVLWLAFNLAMMTSAAVPRMMRLGIQDVHDEQSFSERLTVMTIMRRLQLASSAKLTSGTTWDTYAKDADPDPAQPLTGLNSGLTETSGTSARVAETSGTSAGLAKTSATSAGLTEASVTSAGVAETSATSAALAETSATSAALAETSAMSAGLAETAAMSAGVDETSATSAALAETSATSAALAETAAMSAGLAETSEIAAGVDETSATSAAPAETSEISARMDDKITRQTDVTRLTSQQAARAVFGSSSSSDVNNDVRGGVVKDDVSNDIIHHVRGGAANNDVNHDARSGVVNQDVSENVIRNYFSAGEEEEKGKVQAADRRGEGEGEGGSEGGGEGESEDQAAGRWEDNEEDEEEEVEAAGRWREGEGAGGGADGEETEEEEVQAAGLLFEGDIMLSAQEAEEVVGGESGGGGGGRKRKRRRRRRKKRKVTYSKKKLWDLPIPFLFDEAPLFTLNSSERVRVKAAIAHLEALTCITFRQVNATDPVRPILSFKKDAGCWSYVGKEKAFHFQEVSTGEGCFAFCTLLHALGHAIGFWHEHSRPDHGDFIRFGTLLHELGHAIGFWHEHSRPDRGDFIRVHTERVRLGEEFNFKVESWGQLDNMNVPYDVSSIMHYGSTYFSRSAREVTVEAVDGRLQRVLGQRLQMSFYDVKLANLAYCSDVCVNSPVKGQCEHEGYPDPKRCDRCRCPTGLSGATCQQVAPSQGTACGGQLTVDMGQRYSISSPSYPWVYPPNLQCSWLIKTAPGLQVSVSVSDHDFMTHHDCSPFASTVCIDYLEIKYNVSFAHTGARYCCGLPPQDKVVSSGDSMLVIFRTRRGGRGGFQANVTAEPCGGCVSGGGPPQPACRKREERQCVKTWTSSEYVPCPVYFSRTSPDCNTWVTKEKTRLAVCASEVEYCCDGYSVVDGRCQAHANSSTVAVQPQTSPPDPPPPTGGVGQDIGQDADSTWSPWSSWQPCSQSCGGCGVQTRRRTCDIPTHCGGKALDEESRACNTFPCPKMVVYMCTKTRVQEYYCGWGKCYRNVTDTGPCYTSCCAGYEDVAGKCVPLKRR